MTLQGLVLEAAALYPDRIAVCFDGCNEQRPVYHTYKSMVNFASELSSFLQSECRFEGTREIGLYCYPGINLPAWILGILQVPAAYSPVDPDIPPELSTYFMKKCNLKYILVEKSQVDKFKFSHATWLNNIITVDCTDLTLFELHWNEIDVNLPLHTKKESDRKETKKDCINSLSGSEENEKECMDVRLPHCLAYVLHTSGTTGIPKIVRVPHTCIIPNIQHLRTLFEITHEDIIFMASPLTFDPSVVEMFLALTSGASLLIVPNAIKMLPSKLATVLFHHHHVTVLQATPTLVRRFGSQLIKSSVLSATTSLRVLALGGEAFPPLSILRSWRQEGNMTQIFNLYGVTEVSSWATCYRIPEEDLSCTLGVESPVHLGFPLLGTIVEVRDANGLTVQEGEGQVFLGGKKRICFLDDEITVPFGTMRATGDFVTVKGEAVFFLGRRDSQIKRNGKRINIECIQQVAEGICQVESCAVIWYHQERLILFVVTKDDLVKDGILGELQKHLPSYAVPDDIVVIEALPFTSHGKIDVSKLTKVYFNYINLKSNGTLKGKEELWERLQYLWKSSLRLLEDPLEVSKDSLFLSNGGDSLKSIWLSNEIETLVGRSIPGLLEVILNCSILDIYNHILQAVFPDEDTLLNRSYCTKRKFSEMNRGEISAKYIDQKSGRLVNSDKEQNAFIALSRGNQILFVNISESLKNSLSMGHTGTRLGKNPSIPTDLISSEATGFVQNVTSKNPLTVTRKMNGAEEISSVSAISEDETSVRASEKIKFCVKWKCNTGKCVDASPLIAVFLLSQSSATVYIGSHSHRIQAIDLYSGKVKWEQILGDRIEASACLSPCGNFIIVGCYNGLIYVLRNGDGKIHWIFATKDTVKSTAIMDPSTGLIYVGSHDHHAYALDIYKEICVWKSHCEGTVFSSPCISLEPHHLYIATLKGLLLALNPATGSRVWTHSCGKPLFSSPQCNLQYVSIGCVDGNLYCFNHMGQLVWQVSTDGPVFSSPCISDSIRQEIFCGSHDRCIYCYNAEGHFQWKFEATASIYATPFTFYNLNLSSDMLLAAASTDGKLWILDAKTGQLQTVHKLPGEVFSSPVVWESMLVVGCRDDYVYCLDLLTATEK
ncbi:beta-alanine-activating enzyme isoform X1 [Sminthopsis crassicaudata]|uniref:beta-alanine-activating enzyme isoform X1 n=2 Tax=Sminthopsis crassicaudata TaxID=9301 RepID=UPI003D68B7BD